MPDITPHLHEHAHVHNDYDRLYEIKESLRLKNLKRYLIIATFTLGASLVLGLLSFVGMFAWWAILPLAITAGVLSVLYEGEIYLQNIKNALFKLTKRDYLKRHLGSQYFKEHALVEALIARERPQFLKDYDFCIKELKLIETRIQEAKVAKDPIKLKAYRNQKRLIEKNVKTFEHIFTETLFSNNVYQDNAYLGDLKKWLAQHSQCQIALVENDDFPKAKNLVSYYAVTPDSIYYVEANSTTKRKLQMKEGKNFEELKTQLECKNPSAMDAQPSHLKLIEKFTGHVFAPVDYQALPALLEKRKTQYRYSKGWAMAASAAMTLGTMFLLGGVLPHIPATILLAMPALASPIGIIALSLLGGIAYGLLTYNALTDMLNNETMKKWWNNFFHNGLAYESTGKKVFMILSGIVLFGLAITLSVFTAGTWWTITQNIPTLVNWLSTIPKILMAFTRACVAGITAFSTLVFDVQNTDETLDLVDKGLKWVSWKNVGIKFYELLAQLKKLFTTGNPFTILVTLLLIPLKIILFLGHLVSIGVNADQAWGIPELICTSIGTISEFFQDLHYFLGNKEEEQCHGHHHSTDLPTKALLIILSPLILLSKLWTMLFEKKPVARATTEAIATAPGEEKAPSVPVTDVGEVKPQTVLSTAGKNAIADYKMKKLVEQDLTRTFLGRSQSGAFIDKNVRATLSSSQFKETEAKEIDAAAELLRKQCQKKPIACRSSALFWTRNPKKYMEDTANQISASSAVIPT